MTFSPRNSCNSYLFHSLREPHSFNITARFSAPTSGAVFNGKSQQEKSRRYFLTGRSEDSRATTQCQSQRKPEKRHFLSNPIAPGAARTRNLRLRRPSLYPVELRAR